MQGIYIFPKPGQQAGSQALSGADQGQIQFVVILARLTVGRVITHLSKKTCILAGLRMTAVGTGLIAFAYNLPFMLLGNIGGMGTALWGGISSAAGYMATYVLAGAATLLGCVFHGAYWKKRQDGDTKKFVAKGAETAQ